MSTVSASTKPEAEERSIPVPAGVWSLSPRTVMSAVAVAVLGFLVPALAGDSMMRFVTDAVVMGLFALSIGFLAAQVGLVSLGHGIFYGGAGYTMAVALGSDLSVELAITLGLAVPLLLSVLVGAVSLRVPGIGFAIVTLGFAQVAYLIVTLNDLRPLFGGFDGRSVTVPSLWWMDRLDAASLWGLVWGVVLIAVVGLWFLRRSRWGLLLSAIRDNEERVRFSGFGTYLPRLVAFAVTGLVAGAAGVLAALDTNYVAPPNIYWLGAVFALIAALIGGTSSLAGPFVGAFIIQFVQARFATMGGTNFYLGLILVVVVAFFPAGILGVAQARWARWRQRRAVGVG